jgi:hypothetical protein
VEIQEAILIHVFRVESAKQLGSWRKDVVGSEEEYGLITGEVQTTTNYIEELPNGEFLWNQISILVKRGDRFPTCRVLLADNGNSIGVL